MLNKCRLGCLKGRNNLPELGVDGIGKLGESCVGLWIGLTSEIRGSLSGVVKIGSYSPQFGNNIVPRSSE